MTRTITAYIAAPIMALTGTRFSRLHRVSDTIVYRCINTVLANETADKIRQKEPEPLVPFAG